MEHSVLQNRNSDDEFYLKCISKSVSGKSDLIIMSARAQSEREFIEIGYEQT